MRTAVKIIAGMVVVFVLALAALTLVACYYLSPGVVMRGIRWGEADVYDYQKFPWRVIESSPPAFHFQDNLDEESVRLLLESDPKIGNLEQFLAGTGTQAFIVIQDGGILYEKYFNQAARDSIVTSFSVAKSFDSALVGIAIQEGLIKSVNDPITEYLPELSDRDARFSEITIRDLLMMSSGIRYSEEIPYSDDAKTYYHTNLRELALTDTEVLGPPGEYFLYNNYHPLLLGLILERAAGMPVGEYLQGKIWKPLGMEYDGSWSLDSQESGFEKMESGINARAIDFAKFGYLYLNRGNWNGNQVVPAEWVDESTGIDPARDKSSHYPDEYGQHIFTANEGGYYKYMWYGFCRDAGDYDFAAMGNFGQYIYVSPDARLVIVRFGEKFGVSSWEWMDIFYQFAGRLADEK